MKQMFSNGVLLVVVAVTFGTTHAMAIERPKIEFVDDFKVNVATGQVTQNLQTVAIGGAMGISHSVSVHANELNFRHLFGFNDKFWHETRSIHLSSNPAYAIQNVFHVSDFEDSATFQVYVNGVPQQGFGGLQPPYTYVAVGDPRHSLVQETNELVWTKPNGTLVKFARPGTATAGQTGLLKEIVYPNGFTITVHVFGLQSVNTNTGFQLKYLYEPDHRPMDKPDNPNLINAYDLVTSHQSGWSNRNPKYIKAINNAVEYCAPSASTCMLTKNWPTATFNWPAGMPRSMFIGDSQVTIIDAEGAVARFDFRAYDLAVGDPNNPPFYEPGREFSPRLIGVTPFGSNRPHYTYDFKNLFITTNSGFFGTWSRRAQTSGVIKSATHLERAIGYTTMQPYMEDTYFNYGIGGGIDRVLISPSSAPGNRDLVSYADTDDGRVHFESSARNFPRLFVKLSGPTEEYEYTRGNLSKVRVQADQWRTHQEAGYPATCTAATQKICNQPEWVRDANGKTTYYTYHAQSGQLLSETSPPNKRGITAQTRFEYTQKSARYFNGGASKVDSTPIWMKTAERYCINSNFVNGACQGADEVVTRFEYNHDNLLLTGVTVTAADGTTQRACFRYDIYGNRIGKTQPKANLSSCQ